MCLFRRSRVGTTAVEIATTKIRIAPLTTTMATPTTMAIETIHEVTRMIDKVVGVDGATVIMTRATTAAGTTETSKKIGQDSSHGSNSNSNNNNTTATTADAKMTIDAPTIIADGEIRTIQADETMIVATIAMMIVAGVVTSTDAIPIIATIVVHTVTIDAGVTTVKIKTIDAGVIGTMIRGTTEAGNATTSHAIVT